MANRSRGGTPKRRPNHPEPPAPCSEPEMRRWPHPVGPAEPAAAPDAVLHYIRCALAYQSQLLAEIKTQLEQLRLEHDPGTPEK